MKHTLATRLLAMMLVVVMVLSCLPGAVITALAADIVDVFETTATESTTPATTAATETTAAATIPVETTSGTIPPNATDAAEESSDATTASTEVIPTEEPAENIASTPAMFGTATLYSAGDHSRGGSTSSGTGKPQTGGYVDQNTTLDPNAVPDNRETYFNAVGITMQVVYYPYGETYNRYNSYDNVINTLKNYTYTDENGEEVITVYDGVTITDCTFIGDPATGRIYKVEGINFDQSSDTYKTFELVTGRHDDFGGTIHPGFHDTVSGPATVSTANGMTTYTMPKPTDIELFLKQIIFGNDYGAWDKTSVAMDASGDHTVDLDKDVSLYTKMLKYLGCQERYIENYLKSYNGYLSVTNDADVMIPTIIWSYIMADSAHAWDDDGTVLYGHGYIGDNSEEGIVEYTYVDPYAEACCDGSDFKGEGNYHGALTNVTVQGKPNRRLITSIQTVGDIVYKSYLNNVYAPYTTRMCDAEAAKTYWNLWWRGEILTAVTSSSGTTRYPLLKNTNGTPNTIATSNGYSSASRNEYWYRIYHNQGARSNGCSWYSYCSYSCYDLLGAHGIHSEAIIQRSYYGRHAMGSGFVNYINAEGVDANDGNKYYFRGYWTPFGEMRTGTLGLKKNVSSEETSASTDLSGWRFEIYETEADALTGVKFIRKEYTDSTGSVLFEGLRYGDTFYIKEAPLERQDKRGSVSGWTTSDQIFVGQVPEDSVLVVGTATNTYVPGSPISIHKSPSCSNAVYAQIEDNPLYSLAGAEYTIYLNGVAQEVLVTDVDGNATSNNLYTIGKTYMIQETKAPAGFKLSNEVYSITIVDGENLVEVEDEPVFDPGTLDFQKANTSTGTAMGNTSYEGAIFKWEYYTNGNWTGTPERTWFFETDSLGYYDYTDDYLLNTDSYTSNILYVGVDGKKELPLGSVKVTEVVAPEGYALMEPLYAVISQPTEGGSAAFDWTDESWEYITTDASGTYIGEEPIDEDTFGKISVQKLDAVTGSALQGDVADLKAKFKVINRSTNSVKIGDFAVAAPGEVCYEFWTDEDGSYTSEKIFPIGTYEIVEAQAPAGMTLNTSWSKTFSVTKDMNEFDFTSDSDALKNEIIRGGVIVYKYDALLGEITDDTALLGGISFSVISLNSNPVVINGTSYKEGDVVATMNLAWNASAGKWQASLPGNTLPYGTYKVVENPKEAGSDYANDYYILAETEFTFQIRTNGAVVNTDTSSNPIEFHNMKTGGLKVTKYTNTPNATREGWVFEVRDSSGNLAATITTNSSGIAAIDTLAPGKYTVKEVGGPDGLWGSEYWICDSTTYNVTVESSTMASVTAYNRNTGSLVVQKATNTGISLRGWVFHVWDEMGMVDTVITTDATGKAELKNLDPGKYYIQEVFKPSTYWEADVSVHEVTIAENATYTHTAVNDYKGKVSVQKSTNTGEDLAGWIFAVKDSSGAVVATLTTDETGYAESGLLLPGSYTVVENGGPEGSWNSKYWAYDVNASGDIHVGRVNMFKHADMSSISYWAGTNGTTRSLSTMDGYNTVLVDPSTSTGTWGYLVQTVQNVPAGTYTLSADIYIDATTTLVSAFWNSSWTGIGSKYFAMHPGWNHVEQTITITEDQTKIMAGWGVAKGNTFHVRNAKLEFGTTASEWTPSYNGSTVTVVGGSTTEHTVTNNEYGKLSVRKTTNTGLNLSGWVFEVKDSEGNVVATLTTDDTGYAISDYLEPGDYTIQEVGGPDGLWGSPYWECDTDSYDITVSGSATTEHTAQNKQYGSIVVNKTTNTDDSSGWTFGVWKVEADGTETLIGKKTIADGHTTVTFDKLEPGDYIVRELIDESNIDSLYFWEATVTEQNVTVDAGESKTAAFHNLLKGSISITKITSTDKDKAGWIFEVRDENGTVVDTMTTDSSGNATSKLLLPGKYTVQEVGGPEGLWGSEYWQCDTTSFAVTVEQGKLIGRTVFNENTGSLIVQKQTNTGVTLQGWLFHVWDESGMMNTFITTDEKGIGKLTGLRPGKYFIQEEFKPNSYWEADVSVHEITIVENATYTHYATNDYKGKIAIQKATNTGENLEGWIFEISPMDGGKAITLTTDENGYAETDLLIPGTYMIRELNGFLDNSFWFTEQEIGIVEVTAGQTYTYDITNYHMGRIKIQKSTNTGKNLGGWVFEILDSTGKVVDTVTTTDEGHVFSKMLMPGHYTVREVGGAEGVADSGYWVCDTDSEVVSVEGGKTVDAAFTNTEMGKIAVQKETNTGTDLAGWVFAVKDSTGTIVATLTTDETGYAESELIPAGNYTVVEIGGSGGNWNSKYWAYDVDATGDVYVGSVNILSNAELTSTSKWAGSNKTTVSAATVDGKNALFIDPSTGLYATGYGTQTIQNAAAGNYVFSGYIYCDTAQTIRAAAWYSISGWVSIKTTVYSCNAGWNYIEFPFITVEDYPNLIVGFGGSSTSGGFYLASPKLEGGTSATEWTPSYAGSSVAAVEGSTTVHAVTNKQFGSLLIQKQTNTGNHLGGWVFTVKDSDGNEISGSPFTTNEQGKILIEKLEPGQYTIQESDSAQTDWICDVQPHDVTVVGGEVVTETVTNTQLTSLTIKKVMLNEGPLDGWQFTVKDSDGHEIEGSPFTTDENGIITINALAIGEYTVEEIFPENSLYYCVGENPVTIRATADAENTVEFQNALRSGSIIIEKVDYFGNHLSGAEFYLEWSEDNGNTWNAVTFHDGECPIKGGCTSVALTDGKLITDNTGFITFEGLYPGLMYRVTETKAPDGYVLLTDYAFTGELPADDLTVSLKIYNSQGYLLPSTGEEGSTSMIALGTAMFLFAILGCVMWVSRITQTPAKVCYSRKRAEQK